MIRTEDLVEDKARNCPNSFQKSYQVSGSAYTHVAVNTYYIFYFVNQALSLLHDQNRVGEHRALELLCNKFRT
jgi:hypothetical protein